MRKTKVKKLRERYKQQHGTEPDKYGMRQVKDWYNRLNRIERMKI